VPLSLPDCMGRTALFFHTAPPRARTFHLCCAAHIAFPAVICVSPRTTMISITLAVVCYSSDASRPASRPVLIRLEETEDPPPPVSLLDNLARLFVVGSGAYYTPRHGVPVHSRDEGSNCVG
jgi:hypothetical protein